MPSTKGSGIAESSHKQAIAQLEYVYAELYARVGEYARGKSEALLPGVLTLLAEFRAGLDWLYKPEAA
jgi:hypothetical protein